MAILFLMLLAALMFPRIIISTVGFFVLSVVLTGILILALAKVPAISAER